MPSAARVLLVGGVARGTVSLPGDKSLSHRSLILSALAPGEQQLLGMSDGADVHATASVLAALGVPIHVGTPSLPWTVGHGALREAGQVLDCGNSGTSMRLLAGLVAGVDGLSVLTGDASLRGRPMARIVEPLRRMGAEVDGAGQGSRAPLAIRGGRLRGIEHRSAVASAQVKSCLLLAGLHAEGTVVVREPHRSRDHSERMLAAFGVELEVLPDGVAMAGGQALTAPSSALQVPGDISAAAFFLVLAALRPGSELLLRGVGVNPTRDGVLEVLEAAGVEVLRERARVVAGEEVADLRVRGGELRAFSVGGALVPRLIDEIPVLSVLAARCPGTSTFADAADLRGKESDRIASTAAMLRAFGVEVEEQHDGLTVHGRPDAPLAGGACVDAPHDHRLAMSAAIAATCASAPARLTGAAAVDTSFPGFFTTLERCLER